MPGQAQRFLTNCTDHSETVPFWWGRKAGKLAPSRSSMDPLYEAVIGSAAVPSMELSCSRTHRTFVDYLPCAKHFPRGWGSSSNRSNMRTCLHGSFVLVGETGNAKIHEAHSVLEGGMGYGKKAEEGKGEAVDSEVVRVAPRLHWGKD